MKKVYEKPVITVEKFEFETIMNTSGGPIDQGHGSLSFKKADTYDEDGNYIG